MASRKISFIEQNCEKFLLCATGVALAGIVVWETIFVQVTVDVGGSELTLSEVGTQLSKRTAALNRKLDGEAGVELPEASKVSGTDSLAAKIVEPVSPATSLARNQPPLGEGIALHGIQADEWYHEPRFAQAIVEGVVVTTDALTADALDKELLEQNPSLAARFPEGAPRDITWATPWIRLDLAALRDELRREDRTSNPQRAPIPAPWFNDTLYVVDVVFERQERHADGTWSAASEVAPVPGQDSWRADIVVGKADASTRETMFTNLAEYDAQLELLEPQFLPVKGDKFIAPGSASDAEVPAAAGVSTDAEKAKRAAQKKVELRQRALERLRVQLEKLGGPLDPPSSGAGGSAGGGFGGPSGGGDDGSGKGSGEGGGSGLGGGGGMQGRNNQQGNNADDENSRLARMRMTKQVRAAERDLAKEEAAFVKEYPTAPTPERPVANPGIPQPKFAAIDSVLAWTHDWTVAPGSTYRYRAVAQSYNPFFSHKSLLVAEQQQQAESFTISTATSEWGPATTIPDPTKFFVLRASGSDGASSARRATIELYRFVDGQVDRQVATCAPGDPVGKSDASDAAAGAFHTPWFIVDIFNDIARDTERNARRSTIVVLERTDAAGRAVREYRRVDQDSASPERIELEASFLDRAKGAEGGTRGGRDGNPSGTPGSGKSGAPGSPGLGT
ncbi:MAG: hypothetical protein EXS03_09175 [Phycisphaerales bacterium]|nr:hypothetical protein [Phycisphaerales bacterium]